MVYGGMRGSIHLDGTFDFKFHEVSEADLAANRWPNAPSGAIHEHFIHIGEQTTGK